MSRYILIPGAGGIAWYWSRVVDLLAAHGADVVAVDLPGDDPRAGLPEYAAQVVAAASGADSVVLVAQSLGGFTAPLAAARLPVSRLIFVNAMVPVPGETPAEWGPAVGSGEARTAAALANGYAVEFDDDTYFLHDVPADLITEGEQHLRAEAATVFSSRCEFECWPDVPMDVLIGAEDRLFPAEFQQRVARERLGVSARLLPGGHLLAMSQPQALAAALLRA